MLMNDTIKQLKALDKEVAKALAQIGADDIATQIKNLHQKTLTTDFWQNQSTAQTVNRQLSKLANKLDPWVNLKKQLTECLELAGLADDAMSQEVQKQATDLETQFSNLKHELLYSGQYDDYDAILNIYAGAGGTDAQDWAQMLLRMYVRWAEATKDISSKVIDQSAGEEAGLKSVTLEINGNLAYGKLKGEQGVHRLVRLSPFNADHLRQTSFARVEVMPKIDQPSEVAIDEKDLKIDVYRAGGHGGQSVNTTDSAVRVTHLPTGIAVAIQNERSQLQNKETALTILRSKLVQLQLEQHKEKIDELKGPNEQAAWGNQIRNYVLHPYNMVKDLRTKFETSDTQVVLDGKIDDFIRAYLEQPTNGN
jgi:peptide chain release factor 2